MTIAHPAHHPKGDTRELRALELYRTRGHEIRHVGEDLYTALLHGERGIHG